MVSMCVFKVYQNEWYSKAKMELYRLCLLGIILETSSSIGWQPNIFIVLKLIIWFLYYLGRATVANKCSLLIFVINAN